ncbi:MAG TPA: putative porin, partial [Flavisolibacter sp.]|nr:putative porin [Flavisolibacter sp.]
MAKSLGAQEPVIRLPGGRRPTTTSPNTVTPPMTAPNAGKQGRKDTVASNVERRDFSDDSLKVQVYMLSVVRPTTFDTSISDFTVRFPIPATHIYLGNDGSATKSLLFSTPQRTGWDPGFHTLDVYKWRAENARFFNTPKPYTELGYMLATGAEQMIEILHTQNIRPTWNAAFSYRLLTAPGIFRNQKNSHKNIQLSSWYNSPNKRYNNYFVVLGNKLQAGESGGILTDKDYLTDPVYERSRFTIPTNLGGEPAFGSDLFSTTITTGRIEKETTFFLRQQYDLGRKDSVVTDSVVLPLFYPRLRFEHSLRYGKYDYSFQDFMT